MITTRFFINNLNYGCSFVAKLSRKKKVFLKKYFFYKIYIICRKNVFNMEKSFVMKIFFTEEKIFLMEKNINVNVKYIYIISKKSFLDRKYLSYNNI